MSMSSHRAARALFAIPVLLLGALSAAPSARAQDEPLAALTLDHQTPFSFVNENPALDVRVRADNLADAPLEDLTLAVTLGGPVRTRGAYDASLVSGPLTSYFHQFPQDGAIQPGEAKVLGFSLDLSSLTLISRTESLIYPMLIDLRSGGQPTGAELRTPVLALAREPQQPLEVSWTLELDPPPAIGTDGLLTNPSFIQAIAPGGSLRAEVDALGTLSAGSAASPVDVAISPRFLDELAQMADGFSVVGGPTVPAGEGPAADAAAIVKTLREVVGSGVVEVSALPYAAPNLVALLGGGLAHDLTTQLTLGHQVFSDVLGAEPSFAAARAPGGALDQTVADQLAALGAGVVLADAGTIDRPPDPNGLTLLPTGLLAGGIRNMPLTLPDPGVQALLASPTTTSDPTLAAQAVLGELAAVWQEAPAPDVPRGVVLSTAGMDLPARFWESFANRVAQAPFLHPVSASRLVEDVPPPTEPSAPLGAGTATYSHDYVELIKQERRRVDALDSMLADPGDLPDRLRVSLLVAESGAFVGNEIVGRRWVDGVNATTSSVFQAATPTTSQQFTLISTNGAIPIRLGDPGGRELNVVIELNSSRLRFPEGNTRSVRITQPNQIVTFPVEAASTGQIAVVAVVKAPSGRAVARTNLIVRSTAYSKIALIVTGGAALVLVLLWARRLFRRVTS